MLSRYGRKAIDGIAQKGHPLPQVFWFHPSINKHQTSFLQYWKQELSIMGCQVNGTQLLQKETVVEIEILTEREKDWEGMRGVSTAAGRRLMAALVDNYRNAD